MPHMSCVLFLCHSALLVSPVRRFLSGSFWLLGSVGLGLLRSSFPFDSCGTKAVPFVDAPFLRFLLLLFAFVPFL